MSGSEDDICHISVGGNDNKRSVVLLDPLTLRRSCVARIIEDWSETVGLTIRSVARICPNSGSGFNPNCRLIIINVGGSSVADQDVQRNIEKARTLLPEAPLVIMSDLDNQFEILAAFRAGAQGFIAASLDPKVALRAFTFILGGGTYFPPSALTALNAEDANAPLQDAGGCEAVRLVPDALGGNVDQIIRLPEILTERQKQVAELLKVGLSNKMIARKLRMTEATVKVHVRQIMRKLGVKNRTQVALSISAFPATE